MLDDQYDFETSSYHEFRTSTILQIALQYARRGFCEALKILLTYHLDELEDHIFPLLSNLPESMDPSEFRSVVNERIVSYNRFINYNYKTIV